MGVDLRAWMSNLKQTKVLDEPWFGPLAALNFYYSQPLSTMITEKTPEIARKRKNQCDIAD
jgi:hypothetical protein